MAFYMAFYFAFLGPSSCGHYGRIASIVNSLGIFGLKNVNGGLCLLRFWLKTVVETFLLICFFFFC